MTWKPLYFKMYYQTLIYAFVLTRAHATLELSQVANSTYILKKKNPLSNETVGLFTELEWNVLPLTHSVGWNTALPWNLRAGNNSTNEVACL
jgi:hypothetical protein